MKFLTFFIVYLSEIESAKCFKIYKDHKPWADALHQCHVRLNKGTLAVIESSQEYFDLKDRYDTDHVNTGLSMWLGIYRAAMQAKAGSKTLRMGLFKIKRKIFTNIIEKRSVKIYFKRISYTV